jgi:hypothetical protein
VPGIGILPIGMRLLWRDGARFKPYYVIMGGMIGYTQKTFSQYASYENLGLDQSIGIAAPPQRPHRPLRRLWRLPPIQWLRRTKQPGPRRNELEGRHQLPPWPTAAQRLTTAPFLIGGQNISQNMSLLAVNSGGWEIEIFQRGQPVGAMAMPYPPASFRRWIGHRTGHFLRLPERLAGQRDDPNGERCHANLHRESDRQHPRL